MHPRAEEAAGLLLVHLLPSLQPTNAAQFSVPYDHIILDALECDLKREKMGIEPTMHIVGEPARSFAYDPSKSL